jgi:tetraprenyl-beta-curcumene synthase
VLGPARSSPASLFAGAARDYWLEVFPQVRAEIARWHAHAQRIPDRELRALALDTQRGERGNLEGAAAFAVLVPRERRREVIKAAVCFQSLYDYLDTLAEQPGADAAHRLRLHLALGAALDPRPLGEARGRDLDRLHAADGGYVAAMVLECRTRVQRLPSWHAVAAEAHAATARMAVYQTLIHGDGLACSKRLERWACALTPGGSGLRWWETAAAAASSLGVFAMMAAAARPALGAAEADAVRRAYFPWAGALHVLLDSLVDRGADLQSGHRSLIGHYASAEQMAGRLGAIARQALAAARSGREGELHALILAAMACFYLSRPGAGAPDALPARERVLGAIGAPARPAMTVLRARHLAERLTRSSFRTPNSCLGPVT